MAEKNYCASCGMQMLTMTEYHPWVVCELFKRIQDSEQVIGNVREVVRYGMKAQEAGATLDEAMLNTHSVIRK